VAHSALATSHAVALFFIVAFYASVMAATVATIAIIAIIVGYSLQISLPVQ
jgi:hypothetical protein